MRRYLALLLLAVILAAPVCGARDLITHTFASIVRVEAIDAEGHTNTCTGFMVAPRQAITAAHCITSTDLKVDGQDATVIKRDGLFVLLTAGDKPALKLARKLKIQEEVTSFGFAWTDMHVLRRYVSGFKDGDFAIDGPLAPGMSGGPTVNQAGDVVGLNQGSNTVVGVLCGAGEIQAFLSASPR